MDSESLGEASEMAESSKVMEEAPPELSDEDKEIVDVAEQVFGSECETVSENGKLQGIFQSGDFGTRAIGRYENTLLMATSETKSESGHIHVLVSGASNDRVATLLEQITPDGKSKFNKIPLDTADRVAQTKTFFGIN